MNLWSKFLKLNAVLLITCTVGCTETNTSLSTSGLPQAVYPRVIRLLFGTEGRYIDVRINERPIERGTQTELGDLLVRLSLKHGDIILVDYSEAYKKLPDSVIRPVFSFSEKTGTALYLLPDVDSAGSFFVLPVYHWVTPYESPLDLDGSSFFLNGKLLGKGQDGFKAMVRDVEGRRLGSPLFLGCHVKDQSLTGTAVPFWALEEALNRALKSQRLILTDMNLAGP